MVLSKRLLKSAEEIFAENNWAEPAIMQKREGDLTMEMDETKLLERITINADIFGGKPIIRGRRLAVEHVLGMLALGDSEETILEGYPWLETRGYPGVPALCPKNRRPRAR